MADGRDLLNAVHRVVIVQEVPVWKTILIGSVPSAFMLFAWLVYRYWTRVPLQLSSQR